MTDLLEFARFHYISEWVILALLIAGIMVLNRVFKLNFINALFLAQLIFIFNAIPIIAGFVDGYIPLGRAVHFFLTELILMIAICAVYRFFVKTGLRNQERISSFFTGFMPFILIGVGLGLAVFTYAVTPQDGTSRILYQTNYWYSLVKPISAVFGPVSYFAAFVILVAHRRRSVAYGLLLVSVFGSIASASKGAFVTQALLAFLMVRDLGFTDRFKFIRVDFALIGVGLVAGVALSLQRLRLNVSDLWDRVMLYGEPTLLTYFAPDPTAACAKLTLLAKMHRGWARAIGDPTALDIDTLFGYAWTIQYVGVNTFTGPNARYSSYLICNFPGVEIVFGLLMTAVYFTLIVLMIRLSSRKEVFFPVFYAFATASIVLVGQDFNLLMQDINLLLGMIILIIFLPRSGQARGASTGLEARS